MYRIVKQFTFDSAHFLRKYEGKCANMHGHTYRVEVKLVGEVLDERGMLLDFGELKKIVSELILEPYDHKLLNSVTPFDCINPTAEQMAEVFFKKIDSMLGGSCNVVVYCVRVWETPTSYAEYLAR